MLDLTLTFTVPHNVRELVKTKFDECVEAGMTMSETATSVRTYARSLIHFGPESQPERPESPEGSCHVHASARHG